ncbi:MAG: DPP IV N-terminal domain-containing protein [Hymenobacter sp.]
MDWSPDGRQLAFVSTSRDHKQEKVRVADAATGAVREVFSETVPTQYESGQGAINWRYLPKTKEVIWYSERDNWGHLYLYDATTGKVKQPDYQGQLGSDAACCGWMSSAASFTFWPGAASQATPISATSTASGSMVRA